MLLIALLDYFPSENAQERERGRELLLSGLPLLPLHSYAWFDCPQFSVFSFLPLSVALWGLEGNDDKIQKKKA